MAGRIRRPLLRLQGCRAGHHALFAAWRTPADRSEKRNAGAQTLATHRLYADKQAQAWLAATVKLRNAIEEDYDAVFYPGGHGPLWDLAENPSSIDLIETMYRLGRPVAAVCHGPAAFRHTRGPDDQPLLKDKRVTGFTNTEEVATGLIDVVPFLVESMLRENGGRFTRGPNWFPHSEVDGNLFTGQNPASSESTAKAVLHALAVLPFLASAANREPVASSRP